jgi:hypothetical protein
MLTSASMRGRIVTQMRNGVVLMASFFVLTVG